jgi:hypothetical protein
MEELIEVTMKLHPLTVKRVEDIRQMTGEQNQTRIIATGIQLLKECVKAKLQGKQIILKDQSGKEEEITFIGFGK